MNASARRERGMRRVRRVALALLVAGLTVASGLAASVRQARAHAGELLRNVGAEVMRYADSDQDDAPRVLVVNGLPLHVGSGGTPDGPGRVLDAFHARCRERGMRFDLAPSSQTRPIRPPALRALPLDGVLRLEDAARGYVACLDAQGRVTSLDDLLARARLFLADGDLAHFGALRFAMVERHGARTHYLALWSEGSLPLARAFPARGDAPGRDPSEIPRVTGTRRILSAWQTGHEPMIALYRASQTGTAALAARYHAALRRAGFRVEPRASDGTGFVTHRDGAWFLIAIAPDGSDAIASVTPL
jgi:hypothetical protein